MVERFAQGSPRLGGLVEGLPAPVVEAVVLAMWPFFGRHDVRVKRPGLVEAPQRAVDGGVTDVVKSVFPQPPDDIVAIAIRVGQHGQHRQVEHALQELRGIYFGLTNRRHGTTDCGVAQLRIAQWDASAGTVSEVSRTRRTLDRI